MVHEGAPGAPGRAMEADGGLAWEKAGQACGRLPRAPERPWKPLARLARPFSAKVRGLSGLGPHGFLPCDKDDCTPSRYNRQPPGRLSTTKGACLRGSGSEPPHAAAVPQYQSGFTTPDLLLDQRQEGGASAGAAQPRHG